MMTLPGSDRFHPKGDKNKVDSNESRSAAWRALTSLSAAIYKPATRQWLLKHLLHKEEGKGLHPGCGGGEETLLIASLLGKGAILHGIDDDPALIEAARQTKTLSGLEHIHFAQAGLSDWKADTPYDFIYARIETAATPEPDQWLAALNRNLKTGGTTLLEIINPAGFQGYPYNHAFARAMELIGRLEDNQPSVTEQLPGQLEEAGFTDVETTYASPAFISRACNRIASLSLECYRAEILRHGESNQAELNALLQELRAFEQQTDTLISRPGVLQIKARKNEPSQ